jgi:hypothetical protein
MRFLISILCLSAFCCALATRPSDAHHSYTMFDMQQNLTLEGTIKELQWTNPHIWIQILAKDSASGQEQEWSIEGQSPNMLTRAGWSRKTLKPGDKAVAVIHPLKSGDNRHSGSLASLKINGKQVLSGRQTAAAIQGEAEK